MKTDRFEAENERSLTATEPSRQAAGLRGHPERQPACNVSLKGDEALANLRREGTNLQELAAQQALVVPATSETARIVLQHF
jgi:hypothetical protein